MSAHRHAWVVTRRERSTDHPLVRQCKHCGEIQRFARGRWVVSIPGK